MLSNDESRPSTSIDTGGGAIIGGNVNTGGDFVGRDKVTITEETAYTVHGLENPYLGLRAFRYKDRAIYAGREPLAQETVQRLTTSGAPQTILFITGASGSGKSSFAQAALIPLLEVHYAAYQKRARHAIFRPSGQPIAMLANALQKLHPNLTPETLATHTHKDQINILLIDQFEELFIQSDASQRAPFCDFLTNLPSFATSRTHILITLRVDYLDELFAIQPLWAIAKEGIELRAMSADDLRNAIQKPLQVNHPQHRFAPELLDRLVQDAGKDAALLPLLQVTLAELWKAGKLVSTNYHSLTDAIRQRAEMVYAFHDFDKADRKEPRSEKGQQELMSILLDLINVSVDDADRRDVRQRRTRQELAQGSPQRLRLIEELVNARLLAATSETRNSAEVEVIDIIHESLIDNWERLRQAIDEQRQQLQRRARFKLWLGEWLRNGRQDGYLLLTDMQLAEARVLVEERDIEARSGEAREFYRRSVEWREADRQKELQRIKELAEAQWRWVQTLRWALVIVSMLLLLTGAFAWYARNRQGVADQKATEARVAQTNAEQQAAIAFSRQLAAQSVNVLSKDNYELAILLAIESGYIHDTFESFAAIRNGITNRWHSRVVFYGHTSFVYQTSWSHDDSKILTASADNTARIWNTTTGEELVRLEHHTGTVYQAIWSHDDGKILTASTDHTARIWDAATGQELIRLEGHADTVSQATWSYDEHKVLTASRDGTARIWDAATSQELVRLEGHTDAVSQATWSHSEQKVLTTGADNTARIWDAVTGQQLMRIEGHTGFVHQAAWSRNERKILTASSDGTARIWDATTGQELVRLEGHAYTVYQATWSHDEQKVLTRSDDHTARIWDASTGQELVKLVGHTNAVYQATWSHNEHKVLTASGDGTARIWDAATGQELIKVEGHTGSVHQATWNHDESRILIISDDILEHTARIWDAATGQELVRIESHTGTIYQATWSHDESTILIASGDGTARIWDATTGQELVRLEGHTNVVLQATWSNDERKALTASGDGTARIWDAITGQELVRLEGHTGFIEQATWSQDEKKVLTTSGWIFADYTARIWDAATGQELVRLEGNTGFIEKAAWSHDERKILTTGADNTARIWDAATGQELVRFKSHTDNIYQATWSHDDSMILTASADNTARIWDAATGQELVKLKGHTNAVSQATWSHDEHKILTRSSDHTARVWDAATGQELVRLEGHTNVVSQATWSHDEHKILTTSTDGSERIWDAVTGQELVRLEGHTGFDSWAIWGHNDRKVLTYSDDGVIRIEYVQMRDLVEAACQWAPRNFTWSEWSTYMTDNVGAYRPTCPNAPIPPDAIEGIQEEARQQIRDGQLNSATQRLTELNGWLQINGQFKGYGVDVDAFVAEVSATATAEALPPPTPTPASP